MSLTLTLARGGGEVSGSGTNIELDGTIAGGAIESVELNGDTQQTTYSGKNLLNITKGTFTQNGITFTQNPDGSVTMNGTSTGNAYYEMNNTAASQTTITSGVRYTLSIGNVTLPSGQVIVQLRKVNPNTIYCAVSDKSASFTAPETTATFTYIGVYGSGVTLNNVTIYPMLEVGSSMTSFEPYVGGTASPNPDYPQEVQTVTGEQTITISDGQGNEQTYPVNLGKNLLPFTNQNFTLKGVTFTVTDGTLYLDGTSQGETYANDQTFKDNFSFTLQPGTYTFSRNNSHLVTVQIKKFSDGTLIASTNGTYLTSTFTLTEPTKVVFGFYMYQNVFDNVNLELMLEKGSTATTYAPYFTPIELCKIGTYQDYIYKSGEDWYVHKETGKLLADVESGYIGNGDNYTNISYFVFDMAPDAKYYNQYSNNLDYNCTHATPKVHASGSTWDTSAFIGGISMDAAATKYWLGFQKGTTLADMKSDLLGMLVYYPLATATDTQITNATLISELEGLLSATTYSGTTYITVSGDLASPLEVKASATITKTYTEVEIGSPFTIADVEGKSSNTTLDGNVYVDWAYNKKQYSFDLFNLTPQDYADIRAFYDYQFNNSAFPTITVPELNIDRLPVYMEISSRNIINQCLLTDKLTIKFRETVQP